MQLHKRLLDEVEEESFDLIAIYSNLEAYRMAWLLNRNLDIRLKRSRQDVDFLHKSVQAMFALFSFKDTANYQSYSLVTNKFKGTPTKVLSAGSLFSEEEIRPEIVYLIPEYKKADFFLKIEEEPDAAHLNRMVNIISQIPQVLAATRIDIAFLKSKQNLIFD
jgi:hypothetical protein